ncbi:MAG: D-glycero-alpha-D-manno-heptose-1,7-bisphosphate 7-phosphatase [Rhodospirillales bacterium]
MRCAVFLDRDGVIIRTNVLDGRPYAITSLEELEVLEGAADAIARLRDAGFLIIVVSNQPDAVTGKVTRAFVEVVNAELMDRLAIDEIKVCYEVNGPDAICYKPRPRMLLDAAEDHGIDLGRSFMVGDRWRDVGAGNAAGCRTIFIDHGYRDRAPENPDHVVRSLKEAADLILEMERD